jgi:hypothetical protein
MFCPLALPKGPRCSLSLASANGTFSSRASLRPRRTKARSTPSAFASPSCRAPCVVGRPAPAPCTLRSDSARCCARLRPACTSPRAGDPGTRGRSPGTLCPYRSLADPRCSSSPAAGHRGLEVPLGIIDENSPLPKRKPCALTAALVRGDVYARMPALSIAPTFSAVPRTWRRRSRDEATSASGRRSSTVGRARVGARSPPRG